MTSPRALRTPGALHEPCACAGTHHIGHVAERVGLSLRTVRHYDEVGLVVPSGRTPGGFRLYTDDDVARLALITRMKPLGLSLDEMRELLVLRDRLAGTAVGGADHQVLLDRSREYAAAAVERCENPRRQLAHADAFATTLQHEVTRHGTPSRGDR